VAFLTLRCLACMRFRREFDIVGIAHSFLRERDEPVIDRGTLKDSYGPTGSAMPDTVARRLSHLSMPAALAAAARRGGTLALTGVVALATATAAQAQVEGKAMPRPGGVTADKDRRIAIDAAAWPWSSIGRVNFVLGTFRGHCTGTLVGERHVLTAAHCLYDRRVGKWANMSQIHFVLGQVGDKHFAHADVVSTIIPQEYRARHGRHAMIDAVDHQHVRSPAFVRSCFLFRRHIGEAKAANPNGASPMSSILGMRNGRRPSR
jgi:Trypsin